MKDIFIGFYIWIMRVKNDDVFQRAELLYEVLL